MSRALFLSLPIDLQEEIIAMIPSESYSDFRLVCKAFRESITPHLFSQITIHFTESTEPVWSLLEMLETLTRTSHPAILAKSIVLSDPLDYEIYRPIKEPIYKKLQCNLYRRRIKKLLPLALTKFKNATALTWKIKDVNLDWSRDSVLSGICLMKGLTALTLDIKIPLKLSLMKLVPAIQEIILRTEMFNRDMRNVAEVMFTASPFIRHIEFHYGYENSYRRFLPIGVEAFIPIIAHSELTHLTLSRFFIPTNINVIANCRSLTSLCLTSLAERIAEDDQLWLSLNREKIRLKEITLSEPNMNFLRYLKSYTGLRKLIIDGTRGRNDEQMNEVASNFYASALHSHIEHIEQLSISSVYEGMWCFGRHAVGIISLLDKLRYLRIPIGDSSDKITMFGDLVPYRLDWPDKMDYPMILLMETTSMLPKLETLFIHEVKPAVARTAHSYPPPKFEVSIAKQLDMQITTHGPLGPMQYRFIIETDSYRYRLRRRAWDGQYWFRIVQTYTS